ncbi:MAG: radical SAM family heme chaperone HemW [Firmicutes bacterium]|nr:radical SAM family heme chaperone HemW [Bacillota bacterium]
MIDKLPLTFDLPASLYIHVPFCARKCLYCDFVSYPHSPGDERDYLAGLEREMALWAGSVNNQRWTLSTVFIGGGTPTCLSPGGLGEIISSIDNHFEVSPKAEFTIEANPGTVNPGMLADLRRAGVNRLSLGAQSCHDQTLRALGRIHTHARTVESFQLAREAGFDNISVDLMFGVPGQSPEDWLRCLEIIIGLGPEHVSAYGLQLEPGTPLYAQVEGGLWQPGGEDMQLAMYYAAVDALEGAGLRRYEISNYALPGLECRHNLVYWRNDSYLGLGPAAHSRLGNRRLANLNRLDEYLAALDSGSLPVLSQEEIKPADDIFETVFLGLRLAAGLNLERFQRRFGISLAGAYPGLAESLVTRGMLAIENNHLRLTRCGLAVANAVMAEFAPI